MHVSTHTIILARNAKYLTFAHTPFVLLSCTCSVCGRLC